MEQSGNISKFEIFLYFTIWICSIIYSIYSVIVETNGYFLSNDFDDIYNDFTEGWNLLNRLKDISDIEWKYVTNILFVLLPWLLIHIIISEILRYLNKQLLTYWYTIISLLFIYVTSGFKILIYFLFQPILGYIAVQFKRKLIVWIYYIFSLIVINSIKWLNYEIYHLHGYTEYITTTGIFWINLRCLTYFLEVVNNGEFRKITFKNIAICLAYCFYLPVLFLGPLILFTDFQTMFVKSNTKTISERLKELFKNLVRFIWWIIFTEFILHFVYVNALNFQPEMMKNLNSWALYGAGYCMGQFFQLKYVIFYGLSTTVANFEGIPVPDTPKCIARIHLYSDMWKYFDRGLYLFLLRYIYIPLSGGQKTISKKLFASFICFLFVYIWHGTQSFIAIWSFLNFIGVTIETISYELLQTNIFKNNFMKHINSTMFRRLKCILASPLFAMSAISNFYFFAGKEIGDIYLHRFLQGSFFLTINILIVLYCGSQVSIEIKLWEQSKKINIK